MMAQQTNLINNSFSYGLWDLPNGWEWVRLGQAFNIRSGTLNPSRNPDEPFSLYSMPAYDAGGIPEVCYGRDIGSSKVVVQTGDILLSKLNPRIPRVWYVSQDDNRTKLASTDFLSLVCQNDSNGKSYFHPDFIKFLLLSKTFRDQISRDVQGATGSRQRLNRETILSTPLPRPRSLDIQRRIVARIEALLAEVRSSHELLKQMRRDCDRIINVSLEEIFQKLITEYELELLGGDSTKRSYIQHLTSGSRGWSKYSSSSNTGPLFIRAGNVDFSRMDLKEIERLNLPLDVGETERSRVRPGDVLVTITGANTGECCVVPDNLGEAYVNQHVALVRLTGDLEPHYLMWFILSPSGGVSQTAAMQYGQTKPGLSLTNIRNFRLPVPNKTVQRQVTTYLDSIQSEVAKMIELMEQDAKTLDLLEQSILERAFRGEL